MDRNNSLESKQIDPSVSLSARRAWIEIVDPDKDSLNDESLSARRAWIEMYGCYSLRYSASVALRKESVDRNSAGREYDTEG